MNWGTVVRIYGCRSREVRVMGLMKFVTILIVLISVFAGCAVSQRVATRPSIVEFEVPQSRAQVSDASLLVAQILNLDVAVLEKDSGFIRFEHVTQGVPVVEQRRSLNSQQA